MDSTAVLGLPLIDSSQASPEITHNEAISLIQSQLYGVKQVGLNAAPGSPAEGDSYVVGAAGSGAFAGHDNQVALYLNAQWNFLPDVDSSGTIIAMGNPQEGMRVWDKTTHGLWYWSGAAWRLLYVQACPVANLPAAGAALQGARGFVTDSSVNTFGSAVAGSGSDKVPVYCDGAGWLVG
jgi:hypothetical protein